MLVIHLELVIFPYVVGTHACAYVGAHFPYHFTTVSLYIVKVNGFLRVFFTCTLCPKKR